jgi:hypothetical protein
MCPISAIHSEMFGRYAEGENRPSNDLLAYPGEMSQRAHLTLSLSRHVRCGSLQLTVRGNRLNNFASDQYLSVGYLRSPEVAARVKSGGGNHG